MVWFIFIKIVVIVVCWFVILKLLWLVISYLTDYSCVIDLTILALGIKLWIYHKGDSEKKIEILIWVWTK